MSREVVKAWIIQSRESGYFLGEAACLFRMVRDAHICYDFADAIETADDVLGTGTYDVFQIWFHDLRELRG